MRQIRIAKRPRARPADGNHPFRLIRPTPISSAPTGPPAAPAVHAQAGTSQADAPAPRLAPARTPRRL